MSTNLHRQSQLILSAGALLGVTGVILGAYGAHGLETTASRLASWDVAVQYQLLHAIVLLVLGIWNHLLPRRLLRISAGMLVVGVVLFSGSIFGLVLFQLSWLGPITPLGGVSLILGWLTLFAAVWKARP